MATQGPFSPSTTTDDATVGTAAWTNPNNAQVSDNVYATVAGTIGSNRISHYLKATNFGFSIPSDATINGVLVEVERKCSFATNADNSVKLVVGGSIVGTDLANSNQWSTSDVYASFGSSSNLWGLSLSVSDINASNFGVAFSANAPQQGACSIDHIRITVSYTSASNSNFLSLF